MPEQGSEPRARRVASLPCRRLGGRWRCQLGGLPGRSPADVAVPESVGGACFLCCPPTLPLVFFPAPIPPPPFPAGRGRSKVYFAGGEAPGTPALDRSRHLQTFPNRSPAQRGVRGLPPEWQDKLFFGQCRQPRRGGTGGDGTIRRTRRRRLRWSSPPGQGEQVPPGAPPLASPGAESGRHRSRVANHAPVGGLLFFSPAYPASAGAEPGRHLPCPPHPAAFSETGTSRGSVNKNSRKVLGGLGDSFKSPPAFLPSPFPPAVFLSSNR